MGGKNSYEADKTVNSEDEYATIRGEDSEAEKDDYSIDKEGKKIEKINDINENNKRGRSLSPFDGYDDFDDVSELSSVDSNIESSSSSEYEDEDDEDYHSSLPGTSRNSQPKKRGRPSKKSSIPKT